MAWDDDKGPGDGLPSSEWDAHVADQKNRAPITVQSTEPAVGVEGALWADTIEVFARDTTFVNTDGIDEVNYTASGSIIYANEPTREVVKYDIDSDSTAWSFTASTTISEIEVETVNGRVFVLSGDTVASIDLSTGSQNWSNTFSFAVDSMAGKTTGGVYVSDGGGNDAKIYNYDGSTLSSDSIGTIDVDYTFGGYNYSLETDESDNIYATWSGGTESAGVSKHNTVSDSTASWKQIRDSGDITEIDNRLFQNTGTGTVELSLADGTEVFTYSRGGDIGYDFTNDDIFVSNGSTVYRVDTTGTEVDSTLLPDGVSAITSGFYNGNDIYAETTNDTVATYTTQNEYDLYVSDGTRWMNPNSY